MENIYDILLLRISTHPNASWFYTWEAGNMGVTNTPFFKRIRDCPMIRELWPCLYASLRLYISLPEKLITA